MSSIIQTVSFVINNKRNIWRHFEMVSLEMGSMKFKVLKARTPKRFKLKLHNITQNLNNQGMICHHCGPPKPLEGIFGFVPRRLNSVMQVV
jgi:hypothetical protein